MHRLRRPRVGGTAAELTSSGRGRARAGCQDRNNTPPGSSLHNFTSDETYAAALGILGGTNSNCGGTYGKVPEALAAGAISKAQALASAAGVYEAIFATGAANAADERPYASLGADDIDTAAMRRLALAAATQGTVLLKNDGALLPLRRGATVAAIGPLLSQSGASPATLPLICTAHVLGVS